MLNSFSKKIHFVYIASLLTKSVSAVFEFIASFIFFSTGELTKLAVFLTQHELGEDPTDFIANRVREFVPTISFGTQFFAAWYFLVHGIINTFLVASLLRKKVWAFPAAIGIHLILITFQLFRYFHTYSVSLLVLSLIDVIVIYSIWNERKYIIENLPMV